LTQWIGTFKGRVSIAAFLVSGKGLIAGRRDAGGSQLRDDSGVCPLPESILEQLDNTAAYWLALDMRAPDQGTPVYIQQVHPSAEVARARENHEVHQKRWTIHQNVRRFFLDTGFTEVDTPLIVSCPGMEPYLDSFPAGKGYLRTSPELHMKRLLAMGYQHIFQMGPCFRAGDHGSLHREEFHMLEWYRAFADLNHLMEDIRNLLAVLAPDSHDADYFSRPPEQITCAELFYRHLDLELKDHHNREPLRATLRARNISFDDGDDWDTLYFLLFLNFIEPHLGHDAPLIVTDYPAGQAALAKTAPSKPGRMDTCYRFELYIKGIEIANAFYELTDPETQRIRFEEDQRIRAAQGKVVYPIDEDFMAALTSGIPPSAGIALGVDRLVMMLLGKSKLKEILPFPPGRKSNEVK
jgi:lysyl-tRNA synthetase class 2